MNVIDMSHFISEEMPAYPGTEGLTLTEAGTIGSCGFAEKRITMSSHTGTHMDAPSHMVVDAKSLDQFDPSTYVGRAVVIDVSHCDRVISKDDIASVLHHAEGLEFILLHTGWDREWGNPGYFNNYPVLSAEAAAYISGLGAAGVGVDAISVDPVGDTEMKNHMAFFNSGMVIIENLCNLEGLPGRTFQFVCLPLKFEDADGSPVRAVGLI